MKTKTLAAALACLCILSAPAMALDIGLGASLGGSASGSSGEGGLSLGLGANAGVGGSAGLGLDSTATDNTAGNLTANASAAASLTSDDELGVVISLIESSNWTDTSLANLTEIDATAYDVSGWIDADNEAAFDLALSGNAGEIEDLQTAVAGNAALDAWLEASNHDASDVIAIGVAADGSLAVFTN
ncbi:MAG: hypothetical protein JWQ89_1137 [Devosia sp.]|uniref:hypothetical protein n=1 Tax=Devosia sp. TaxID=1871048 RepID=UPI00262832CB|nr:hypothetical protein [Devosia sp.]MDB5539410.1 hypothetical protein [Devosia sp.]